MNREEFFAKLAPLDEDRLRKVLWNLYWRGPAAMRERIEGELDPVEHARRKQAAAAPPSRGLVLYEVREFAELARAGAYLAGDRRVSPKERTRWRVTFRRLAAGAQAALRAPDPAPGAEALALLIDQQAVEDILVQVESREQDNPRCGGAERDHPAGRLYASQLRHPDVHHDDARAQPRRQGG
jgi:hypothetical protein